MGTSGRGLPPRERSQRTGKPAASPRKKKKKSSPGKVFLKTVLGIMLIVLIVVGIWAGRTLWSLNSTINEAGTDKPLDPARSAKVKPISMLLLGTDYRPESKTHLSDVIMLMVMNPQTKTATLVSVPRDTRISLKGYKTNKINAFYPIFLREAKESGISAESEMKTMMGKFFNLDIDYVTVLNFQGFRDIVDALDGVDVNVDKNMCYVDKADGTNINLKKGEQHLDGKQALDYVRYRKSNCKPKTAASDDFDRNRRQNEVLHALMDQAKSLNGVLNADKVIKSVGDNMTTDLESQQIKDMIMTYWNISKQNVRFVPLVGDWKSPYVYLSDNEINKAKEALQEELAGTRSTSETSAK
ncbi:transcriptional regulator [Paenibacillus sp. CAA11]|uniref:LCP family protein n=1 Tax=Paenibacillus sp. CAA11 TaxID=1532905 RepID=UPI000D3C899D|nr:LCP family protein [Paenibacillus sp. CAA11]AWB45385.1 transcriptional regulator [Paenibacillus sp. CAA11]